MLKSVFPMLFMGLCLLNLSQQASATVIGPDAFGYKGTNEIPFSFQNIAATGTRILIGDDNATITSLGFNFDYYGTSFNTVGVSTNGLMSFGGANGSFGNLPLSFFNDARIAVLWDDWITQVSGAGVYVETVGSVGNRQFITQWNVMDRFGSSPSTVTFQSILYEGSNDIRFNYLDMSAGNFADNGASATVGIRSSGAGNILQWSSDLGVIQDGESILWTQGNATVPEPSSLAVWALGAVGFAVFRFKRKQTVG